MAGEGGKLFSTTRLTGQFVSHEGICCNKCYFFHPNLQVSLSFKSLPSHCISLKRLGSVANNSQLPRKASEF